MCNADRKALHTTWKNISMSCPSTTIEHIALFFGVNLLIFLNVFVISSKKALHSVFWKVTKEGNNKDSSLKYLMLRRARKPSARTLHYHFYIYEFWSLT